MKKTFTILHTNDIHSNLIGMGPYDATITRDGELPIIPIDARASEVRAHAL
jgi:2',3'-cyclic-nucleotide 2'-phosphodiesterase (5'-nucleotidase family)